MKRISITRSEKMTFHRYVELPDGEADLILANPEKHKGRLSELCPPSDRNWLDSEDEEFEVELA